MIELNELAASLTPSNEELVSKQRVLDFLQVLVRKQWPDVRLLVILLLIYFFMFPTAGCH
jgi:DNA polymerase sigma